MYAGWALSQAFYREGVYLEQGCSSLEDYLLAFWEGNYVFKDANDLLAMIWTWQHAMIWTWQHADIGVTPGLGGRLEAALGVIEARAIVMPGETDLYFTVEDNEYEVSRMTNAELRPIPSIWGTSPAAEGTLRTSAS